MVKKVVILGSSSFSLILAHELERAIGGFSHINLTYITNSENLIYPHQATVFGKLDTLEIKNIFSNMKVVVTTVRSVNLRLKEVITDFGVVGYDFIIIDQLAEYSGKDFKELRDNLSLLFAQLSSQTKTGKKSPKAVISIEGDSLATAQLATAIKRDALSHHLDDIIVLYPNCTEPEIKKLLTNSGIFIKNNSKIAALPKLVIKSPLSVVSPLKIKGAKVSKDNQLMVDQNQMLLTAKNAFVIPKEIGQAVNLLSSQGTIAIQYASQIQSILETDHYHKELPKLLPSYYLIGVKDYLLRIKKWRSERFRASLVAKIERIIWNKLKAR